MKYLLIVLMLISHVAFSAPTWVDVPNQNFSYAYPFTAYNYKTGPQVIGFILLDMKGQSGNGSSYYYRALIDCKQMRFTKDQKAIDLTFGNTVYANQFEQQTWWEPIHPDFWAYPLMKQQCGKKGS